MFGFNGEDRKAFTEMKEFIQGRLKTDLAAIVEMAKRKPLRELELAEEILTLKTRIADLKIEEGGIKEKHAQERRELTHMIGLEKKRQEFEIAQAKRETEVKVREENLAADKVRFEQQMTFHSKRFEEEVGYLKDLMGQVLGRLPDITATLEVTRNMARRK